MVRPCLIPGKSVTSQPSENSLLWESLLPAFGQIDAAEVVPAIETVIAGNRAHLENLLGQNTSPDWNSLIAKLEADEDRLSTVWSPVSHLNAVKNSPALRDAYTEALQALTRYNTEVSQNEALYRAYEKIANSHEFQQLSTAQRKTIDNALRDFKLSGVNLPPAEKQRYGEIQQRLSALSTRFANNVLDATQGWYRYVEDKTELAGLPDNALDAARQAAETRQLAGYVITLDIPAYLAVMTHADNRSLREEIYRAYVTRASEQGQAVGDTDPAQWDNREPMEEILALRHEQAQLLGFDNYAELSLATKMAESTDEVVTFLQSLAQKAKPVAQQELAQLKAFAVEHCGLTELAPWDLAYVSEKQRQAVFAISEEELRPYFPAGKVIEGLFAVVEKLFQVRIEPDDSVATWHPDARYYLIKRAKIKKAQHSKNSEEIIAGFYLDIYARENKRGGAWMDECRVRRRTENGMQLPVAYLTCNFSPPTDSRPSLLTHSEVTTLFHEFGHGLHHMLTDVDCAAVSGINGVAWDAVELPSQFLENWCWQEEVVPLISAHYETGEPLPKSLLDKMLAAKNYQSAMQILRQLEFSLFDFRLHLEYNPDHPRDPQDLLDEVRQQVAVLVPPDFNRFQNSFSHIFAGGYAAGYYSYKWAEELSADAFSLFEENGIFDRATADKFLHCILQQGGARDAATLFCEFRGRKPAIDALLRHSGIVSDSASESVTS